MWHDCYRTHYVVYLRRSYTHTSSPKEPLSWTQNGVGAWEADWKAKLLHNTPSALENI